MGNAPFRQLTHILLGGWYGDCNSAIWFRQIPIELSKTQADLEVRDESNRTDMEVELERDDALPDLGLRGRRR